MRKIIGGRRNASPELFIKSWWIVQARQMKVLNVEKLRIEKDGSKTEAWFDLTVVGENDEEEKILTSKNTKVSIQRSLRIDNKTARFTIILKNE